MISNEDKRVEDCRSNADFENSVEDFSLIALATSKKLSFVVWTFRLFNFIEILSIKFIVLKVEFIKLYIYFRLMFSGISISVDRILKIPI